MNTTAVKRLGVNNCTGFAWLRFGSWGAVGAAFVRSCQNLPPCLAETMLGNSKDSKDCSMWKSDRCCSSLRRAAARGMDLHCTRSQGAVAREME